LQAVASLAEVAEIHIIDESAAALDLGRQRIGEITDANPRIKLFWQQGFNQAAANGDLCIVATQAPGRYDLIKKIAVELGYRKFLIEKVVAQSIAEYLDLLKFSEQHRLSIWVNCKTRAYEVHRYIKSKLDPNDPIIFSDLGGNHGLGNNGVHAVDLFAYYDGAQKIIITGSRVDQALHPSKRGKDVFDLSGTLYGRTNKGSDFILSFAGSHVSPDQISILTPKGRFIVDHFQKFAFESSPETNWAWKNIPINENWSVSFMSKAFVSDILRKGDCELPTLQDCFPAHEFILGQLVPHFNRLLGTNNDYCPIT